VNRYSPPEVTLVVNTKSSLKELKADWTIYHELSHLLIPYDAGDARWFSEGLASYYQNITQARVGMFDEQIMWQKLYDGFERGNKQQKYSHQPLSYVSDNIGQNRNYMRIYWSGALYWLKADVALRELTKNTASPYSLDLALKQLQQCCFNRYLSVEEIVEKLDELSQSQIFSTLFAEFSASYAIPDYLPLLNSLGVELKSARIELNNHAKLSAQRKAIFAGNSL
jgi:predicted metalloprotease with PDZ domain